MWRKGQSTVTKTSIGLPYSNHSSKWQSVAQYSPKDQIPEQRVQEAQSQGELSHIFSTLECAALSAVAWRGFEKLCWRLYAHLSLNRRGMSPNHRTRLKA